jgi:meiotically up-regulated gene 157 (Mug157) protein
VGQRRFQSAAVKRLLEATRPRIGDSVLAKLFIDCFPNTLDTTVVPGTFAGKPDTAVLTGNIAATWPRDSSAQLWPYLTLAAGDLRLRALLEQAIRRQTRAHGLLRGANAIPGSSAGQPEWESADRMKART